MTITDETQATPDDRAFDWSPLAASLSAFAIGLSLANILHAQLGGC